MGRSATRRDRSSPDAAADSCRRLDRAREDRPAVAVASNARRSLAVPAVRSPRPGARHGGDRACRRCRVDHGGGAWQLDAAGRRRPAAVHQRADAVSRARRRGCPTATRPGCTGAPCASRAAGSTVRWCCTSAAPRACTRCTSTARSPATAPTAASPASTTSPRTSTPASTTSPSSWSAGARRATSRTRTSGGWPACTARCSSRRAPRCTWPTLVCDAGHSTQPPERSPPPPRSAGCNRPTPAGRFDSASRRSAAGASVAAVTGRVRSRFERPYVFTGHTATADFRLPDVEPWSAESPTRYRVVAELVDPNDAVSEVHTQLVGFRSVEVRDRQLLVNGEPIWIFGVNRHDHHPTRGKAVTVDDMRDDLLAMRRNNITALRCCPLSERSSPARPVRRDRHVRHRRGQPREPRVQHEPV